MSNFGGVFPIAFHEAQLDREFEQEFLVNRRCDLKKNDTTFRIQTTSPCHAMYGMFTCIWLIFMGTVIGKCR